MTFLIGVHARVNETTVNTVYIEVNGCEYAWEKYYTFSLALEGLGWADLIDYETGELIACSKEEEEE